MTKFSIRRRSEDERADGTALLYVVIYIERQKLRLSLEIGVTAKEWDPVAEKVLGRSQEAQDKNLIISNTKAKITEILVKARLTGETLTRENFLAMYKNPGNTTNFIEFAKHHLEEQRNGFQPETYRHHRAALRKLEKYDPKLKISDITPEWLRSYAKHLRDFYDNSPGTINKNMCVIRMHYYAAMRAGKTNKNPFEAYSVPKPDPSIVFLTEEELRLLLELYKSENLPDNEQDALRFFLFMTFTGMHISDARALQIEQLLGGEIHYRRIKTRTHVRVPIGGPAAKLIDYYRAKRMRGNLFQRLPTDQAFNRLIKRVCRKVGIYKAVSAKTGRHTFATLYCKKNNGDIATLSRLLGHASIETTMIYAHTAKEDRVAGVAVFDDML